MLDFVLAALKAVPALIAAGADAWSHVSAANAAVAKMQAENRGPSAAEWQALHETIDRLLGEL